MKEPVMATTPVRIDAALVRTAAATASRQHRSIAEQVNRWARLGKEFDLSASVDQRRIEMAVAGDLQLRHLTPEERAIANASITAEIVEGADASAYGEEALEAGMSVAVLNDDGELVEISPDGTVTAL